jgi:N-dimethylarginine dimethylaminohydrolase
MNKTTQEQLGINLIPQPQKLTPKGGTFSLVEDLSIVLSSNSDAEDQFAAEDLITALKAEYGIDASIAHSRLSRAARQPP